MIEIYKCPVCGLDLKEDLKSFKCLKNHLYDKSKEGYTNLLLVNQKSSKSPGDNNEMVSARSNFLNKGYYSELSVELNILISKLTNNNSRILDLGCGEGYYDSNLLGYELYGLDISKFAVSLASKKHAHYVVGSSYNLPYKDNSFELVFCIFSPYDLNEIYRVLNSNGIFILVGPGRNHLKELAGVIYEDVHSHKGNKQQIQDQKLFDVENLQHIEYEVFKLPGEDKLNLLKMTPYYWSNKNKDFSKIDELKSISLEFEMLILRKKII